ncbi:uncharacterized protein TRIADDRAFT_29621 [Trichoplax adhaerens]|uniref:Sodium/hydrogen exchanger n=1 Tax=Trichoplax adhaerens TaxID=10228 RepID=B3S5I3_TRIAD|nr:hypothetical protein TRIADDRAFT_29621 [Trichoplax adhaerens]EDV21919.1 hypothetical protein TRIADDRAFT_29621 [Trichoplax adhaerens]|eukprot:XP_002115556.1 hypothetical protein TRIADDRAFT_29621 [Trichoplax adhaerens]
MTLFSFRRAWWIVFLFILTTIPPSLQHNRESITEEEVEHHHHLFRNVLIIMFVLLLLNILTAWVLRIYHIVIVHETGLAMIYGLITGAVVKYSLPPEEQEISKACMFTVKNDNIPAILHATIDNKTCAYGLLNVYDTDNPDLPQPQLVDMLIFNSEIFFYIMLPPIIFFAGYDLRRRHFFRNFGSILFYAIVGTIISCFVISGIMYGYVTKIYPIPGFKFVDCLLFGAMISATDPVTVLAIFQHLHVDSKLYALVFGESVLNDAVSIVLYSAILTYSPDMSESENGFDGAAFFELLLNFLWIFLGSFGVGCLMGLLTALISYHDHFHDKYLSIFIIISYLTFLIAEAFHLTGIVAILFCGIIQSHYTYKNLSAESRTRTKQTIEMISFLAENAVFSYMGLSCFVFPYHRFYMGFVVFSFIAILTGRLCNIYPISFILNRARQNRIGYRLQHMMLFSGLRGAIAFALAIRNTSSKVRQLMFTTTVVIVFITVLFNGGTTTMMLRWLKIKLVLDIE